MKLYNTLSRIVEDFEPLEPGKVKMFSCGPTVYDYLHIGNARTAVTVDVLSRLLRYSGYKTTFLVNITDIDDKIIKRAAEQGITWEQLARKYEAQYLKDMTNLKVKVDKYIRATDHIDDIIRQINTLMEKGHAYKTDDGIYYEIATFPDYGKLSRRFDQKKDDAMSRIDESDQKRGWNDFCLWKFAKPDEPVWAAPFGDGRPGWHIEDTAITEHYFGPQYDIHGGGSDLIFPHHEAELTQMESASGLVPFVKYWVHGGLLYIDKKRMGKSNNNFITIADALKKYDADLIRLFMLQGHYRSQLDFDHDSLQSTANRLNHWRRISDIMWQSDLTTAQSIEYDSELEKLLNDFLACLQNDLDTPSALVVAESIFDLTEQSFQRSIRIDGFSKFVELLDTLLGINIRTDDIDQTTKDLLLQRLSARQRQEWQKSDELRQELMNQGISVNDSAVGQTWSRI